MNPFEIGDEVRFEPSERAIGLSWSSFDTVRLHPGETRIVTRISEDGYLYLDDERGGFHWECFKRI
jgi:hypothetical protein